MTELLGGFVVAGGGVIGLLANPSVAFRLVSDGTTGIFFGVVSGVVATFFSLVSGFRDGFVVAGPLRPFLVVFVPFGCIRLANIRLKQLNEGSEPSPEKTDNTP